MSCHIIIRQGKNKGLTCGHVNKQCRHINNICNRCGKVLSTDTNRINHSKICNVIPKIKPRITRKFEKPETLEDKIESIIDKKLKGIDSVKNTININNHNTVNINLTTIGAPGNMEKLVDSMGQKEALKFLLDITTSNKNQLTSLIEKLYLVGDPTDYPIANRDGKVFRFRDVDHRIIHDIGGKKIAKLSTNIHSDLYASAATIEAHRVIEDGSEYDKYLVMQKCASSSNHDTKTFVKDLANRTFNPTHRFFTEGTMVIVDD